jgi:hypothetical protein
MVVNSHVSVTTLGVKDVGVAKKFYGDGLGWAVQVDPLNPPDHSLATWLITHRTRTREEKTR